MIIQTINKNEEKYPKKMADFLSSPNTLYCLGDVSILNMASVAVIGKRDATNKELNVARKVGAFLASKGYVVVNGLAIGCDTSAIEGALKKNGKVIAVMPCGLNHIYPRQNIELAKRIIENGGCLISEYEQDVQPEKYRFIERDKIQSLVSDSICVVATDKKGGTMHTVNYSLSNGKQVVCFWDKKDANREGNKWLINTKACKPFSTQNELITSIKN